MAAAARRREARQPVARSPPSLSSPMASRRAPRAAGALGAAMAQPLQPIALLLLGALLAQAEVLRPAPDCIAEGASAAGFTDYYTADFQIRSSFSPATPIGFYTRARPGSAGIERGEGAPRRNAATARRPPRHGHIARRRWMRWAVNRRLRPPRGAARAATRGRETRAADRPRVARAPQVDLADDYSVTYYTNYKVRHALAPPARRRPCHSLSALASRRRRRSAHSPPARIASTDIPQQESGRILCAVSVRLAQAGRERAGRCGPHLAPLLPDSPLQDRGDGQQRGRVYGGAGRRGPRGVGAGLLRELLPAEGRRKCVVGLPASPSGRVRTAWLFNFHARISWRPRPHGMSI